MSTFYVLPSRALLGQQYAEFLVGVFPRLHCPRANWRDLAESLAAEVLSRAEDYVVYREDVPEGADLATTLAAEFGAEFGDEIVEVALGGRLAGLMTRRWRMGEGSQRAA